MAETQNLALCPFCGNAPALKRSAVGDYTSIVCQVTCAGSLVIVIPNDRIVEGVAAWNRRAPAVEAVAMRNASPLR